MKVPSQFPYAPGLFNAPVAGSRPAASSRGSAAAPGVVLNLSNGATSAPATGYTASGASTTSPPPVLVDYFSYGDDSPLGEPQGPTRLEYNVYRPDGFEIDATQSPFVIKATGEAMTPEVVQKYYDLVNRVSSGRVDIYKQGKADGLSDADIRAKLQAYDRDQPQSYKDLVGNSDMVDPATRYMNATYDEMMGGPVQSI